MNECNYNHVGNLTFAGVLQMQDDSVVDVSGCVVIHPNSQIVVQQPKDSNPVQIFSSSCVTGIDNAHISISGNDNSCYQPKANQQLNGYFVSVSNTCTDSGVSPLVIGLSVGLTVLLVVILVVIVCTVKPIQQCIFPYRFRERFTVRTTPKERF